MHASQARDDDTGKEISSNKSLAGSVNAVQEAAEHELLVCVNLSEVHVISCFCIEAEESLANVEKHVRHDVQKLH